MNLTYKLFPISLFTTISLWAQVGIETKNPQKMLDVNGEIRVRKVSEADASISEGLVFVNADGDLKKAKAHDFLEKELGTGGYIRESSNNNWRGLNLGTKSTYVKFVGRTSSYSTDFMFTLFLDRGQQIYIIKNINCNVYIADNQSKEFSVVSSGVLHKFTFSDESGDNVSLTATNRWVQGKFQTIAYP